MATRGRSSAIINNRAAYIFTRNKRNQKEWRKGTRQERKERGKKGIGEKDQRSSSSRYPIIIIVIVIYYHIIYIYTYISYHIIHHNYTITIFPPTCFIMRCYVPRSDTVFG